MGQYYMVVNIDKKEYLHPHRFDDGLKLMEFGQSAGGTLTGLAILLADGNGGGGGDIYSEDPIIGSWAGDRIVIAGDYAEPRNFLTEEEIIEYQKKYREEEGEDRQRYIEDNTNLYSVCNTFYKDISREVVRVLVEAKEFSEERIEGIKRMCEYMKREVPEYLE